MKNSFCTILLAILTLVCQSQTKNKDMRVIAYYFGGPAPLDNYDVTQMTHIIFCFGRQLDGNRYKVSKTDTATIQKMVSLKAKNPNLKVLLSLGGAGGCTTCSDAFSTEKGRKEFVQSIKEMHQYFGTDGLDLDWEFPSYEQNAGMKYRPEDVHNFTLLVKELKTLGKKYEVTFAVGAHKGILETTAEWKEVMKYADLVNIMSYDIGIYNDNALIPQYAQRTALNPEFRLNPHHTALYSTPQQERSTDWCVKYLLSQGVPAKKIIVGAAFYGKMYATNDGKNNGLHQPGKRITTSASFKNFPTQLSVDSGWVHHWDDVAKAPYAYNPNKKIFVTYEDKRSIELKTKYVLDKKLGGIMFWQLGQDTFTDGLLNSIDKVKKTYNPAK